MSLIKMPYEVSNEFYLRALLYGQPGIGKTTTALSAPKPILIDCDNGVHRVAASHRVPYLPVKSYQEILDVLGNENELAPFETIVIDTAGKLLDYMSQWIVVQDPKKGKKDGSLSLQGFGTRKYEFINLLKRISTMGKHLVFVAHEIEVRSDDERIVRPEIGGSSGNDLIKELDVVGYMEALGKQRTISFSPCEKYYAKNSAKLSDVITVPEIKAGLENTFLAGIISKCVEAMNEESEQVKLYNELMQIIKAGTEKVVDVQTANAGIKELADTKHIWDSKIKAWRLLEAKAVSLGLVYNKDIKQFEDKK